MIVATINGCVGRGEEEDRSEGSGMIGAMRCLHLCISRARMHVGGHGIQRPLRCSSPGYAPLIDFANLGMSDMPLGDDTWEASPV